MFQSDVFTIAGWLPSPFTMNGVDEVYWVSRAQLIIALGSTIPGYWFTVATIEIMGRIPIQVRAPRPRASVWSVRPRRPPPPPPSLRCPLSPSSPFASGPLRPPSLNTDPQGERVELWASPPRALSASYVSALPRTGPVAGARRQCRRMLLAARQVMGFVFMTTFMGILAGMYNELKTNEARNPPQLSPSLPPVSCQRSHHASHDRAPSARRAGGRGGAGR